MGGILGRYSVSVASGALLTAVSQARKAQGRRTPAAVDVTASARPSVQKRDGVYFGGCIQQTTAFSLTNHCLFNRLTILLHIPPLKPESQKNEQ
ncbi:hypothetical protein Q4485_11140 [Granulosicoccaceae sp. 1_MG-2023]|nr:hypothetical protein [Granulosicoccaceae sp. 1_MG-2023]